MSISAVRREFFARKGSRFNNRDAAIIGPVIDSLCTEKKGPTPAEVVDAARDDESPIHDYFEWDDVVAAEEHRRQQAREMVRSIEIRVIGASGTVHETRGYENVAVTVTTDDGDEVTERRYVPVEIIREEPMLAEQVLQQASGQLKAWRDRWAVCKDVYDPLQPVFDAIDTALKARQK